MKQRMVVIREFRDAHDFALIHKVGDDVTGFDSVRIKRLESFGYVKAEEDSPQVTNVEQKPQRGRPPKVEPNTIPEKVKTDTNEFDGLNTGEGGESGSEHEGAGALEENINANTGDDQ